MAKMTEAFQPGPLLTPHKNQILTQAAELAAKPVNADAKPTTMKQAAVLCAIEIASGLLASDFMKRIDGVVDVHKAMSGPRDGDGDTKAVWDAGLDGDIRLAFADVLAEIGEKDFAALAQSVRIDDIGNAEGVAKSLGNVLAARMKPLPMHAGKFLSAIGIVESDLAAAPAETERQVDGGTAVPPPIVTGTPAVPYGLQSWPVEAKAPPAGDDFLASLFGAPAAAEPVNHSAKSTIPDVIGIAGDRQAPMWTDPESHLTPIPFPDQAKQATKDELAEAFKIWNDAGAGANELAAKALGISIGTLRNYCTGRTAPRIGLDQARFMVQDCDNRVADLRRAADIFARVR